MTDTTEPRCRCGHVGSDHVRVMVPATCTRCTCTEFGPPSISDEAEAAWHAFDAAPQNFGLIRESVFKAGFRAARQEEA